MPAFITRRTTRAVALAALVAIGSAACQATVGTTGPGPSTGTVANATPTAKATVEHVGDPAIAAILLNLQAARGRHDARALHQYQRQLRDRLGEGAIARADARYRQVLADLHAAESAHDAMARAAFRAELKALCSPTSLTSAIEPCDGQVAAGS